MKYTVEHLRADYAKELKEKLEKSGDYSKVWLSSKLVEDDKTFYIVNVEKYGNKRDYPKLDIIIDGIYWRSTTWASNGKIAKAIFKKKYMEGALDISRPFGLSTSDVKIVKA